FAGHGDVAADGNLGQRACKRRCHGDARGGAVLGYGALGDVQVDVNVAIELTAEPKGLCATANVREGGLRRLLHDIAKLAGDGELAFSVEDSDLSGENA